MAIAALKSDSSVALDENRVGGYRVLESDIYSASITHAYLTTSKGGAYALNLEAKTSEGTTFKEQLWMTSGTAKGCSPYYTDQQGNKKAIPGFTVANGLGLLTIGKEIGDIETEEKVIKLYDYTQKKEVATPVQMFTDLIGQEIKLGLVKQIVDKNVKNGNGEYVPSGETREQNVINKVFRAKDNFSVVEIVAQADEATYFQTWLDSNKGNTQDKSSKDAKPASAPAATPFPAANSAAPTTSLFNN